MIEKRKRFTGRVLEKNGKLCVVISYWNEKKGKHDQAWRSTGLPKKGNLQVAKSMMPEIINKFKDELERGKASTEEKEQLIEDMLFADYMEKWLQDARHDLEHPIEHGTYISYKRHVKVISEYFRNKGITLRGLQQDDIREYYKWMQSQGKTVQECEHHHVNIRRALQVAYNKNLISVIVADKIERPKSPKFKTKYYTKSGLDKLFEVLETTRDKYEWIYKVAAYYGLRRSEVVGLKWSAINFDDDTISVEHAVIQTDDEEGKILIIKKDTPNNKLKYRTLPLLPDFKKAFLAEREKQAENRKKYKKRYTMSDAEYIWVDELGNLIKPDSISSHFQCVLKNNQLPRIRLHDLRHSCASLLLSRGVSMKQIQEWLGHSTFKTTADTYAHLDVASKREVGNILIDTFNEETPTEGSSAAPTEEESATIAKLNHAKAEMKRLGIKTIQEYQLYLQLKNENETT